MTQFQCDTCGKVGTEDDLCADGEECPDEECEGTTWRLGTFEVTVPLVVTVRRDAPDAFTVVDWTIDPGFGGFFSEAQEAQGVWSPDDDAWADNNLDPGLPEAAWIFVRKHLPALKGG